jgi:hypothetical protein
MTTTSQVEGDLQTQLELASSAALTSGAAVRYTNGAQPSDDRTMLALRWSRKRI